ncbi:MAG: HD domain-containing protein [Candidatus Lokiarchaeota archaeon]|nr:HD domain-containing protein [Candidatus Lokiarchaeota archaeon]
MKKEDILSEVRKFSIRNSTLNDIHGFGHVERVVALSKMLGRRANADLFVIQIAALLHDVGRVDEEKDDQNKNPAEISAEKAKEFLRSQKFYLSANNLENIIHSIRAHSFSNQILPHTLEAKVLSDADKLDAIGGIGLYRTIGFTVQKGGDIRNVIDHLENKILSLKDLMYLEISKKLAEDRYKTVLNFYESVKEEVRKISS